MDASQLIRSQIQSLVTGNEIYSTYQSRWQYLLESFMGGDEYRRAGHLTRYQLETDQEYVARLKNTPLDNHCHSVIAVYNSFLFRRDPEREYGPLANLPELNEFLEDADLDGRSLNNFMKDVTTWSSVFGNCWIIVTKPNVGAQTVAQEQYLGIRPYVSLITPLMVLDWRWQRDVAGRYTLSYLKYLEEVNGNVRTFKEWTPETVRTVTVDVKNFEFLEDTVETNGLAKIPAVCVYNGRSLVRGIGISDITDIADAQKFIYNAKSEISQSIQLDSHPSLVATPETIVGTGSGALIRMPENLDSGLKPYVLDFGGADVGNIISTINHTIESIDKMANTGAVRATESRVMSGVAMETEFQLLNAKLSEKGDQMELAEEQMWRLFAEYMGTTWQGKVTYPNSFNIRDTSMEINQLKTAKDTATDSRVVLEIDKKLLEWMGVDSAVVLNSPAAVDLNLMPHPETTPATQVDHIQEMIMEGYTDQQMLNIHAELTQDDITAAKAQLLNIDET